MKFVYMGFDELDEFGVCVYADFASDTFYGRIKYRSHERILFEVDFKHKEGWHSYWVNPGFKRGIT